MALVDVHSMGMSHILRIMRLLLAEIERGTSLVVGSTVLNCCDKEVASSYVRHTISLNLGSSPHLLRGLT